MKKNETPRPFPEKGIGRFSERLVTLIGEESVRSFGRRVEISDGTLRKYLQHNTEPSLSRLVRIAHECGVTIEWLATGQGPMHPIDEPSSSEIVCNYTHIDVAEFNEEFTLIPGYHVNVSTGHGVLADEHPIKRHLAFRKKWLTYRKFESCKLAVVFAKGDSMEPTIHSNNSLLVDMADTKLTDGSIFVLRLGDDLYAKRLQKRFDGGIELLSDNKEYKDQIVKSDEIDTLQILGKVVWVGKDIY
ncbi:putative transcriptional regulator [Shewanella psychrophila]|uniref:Putative transcriptional regulator n=1 Tax=Shewanella psychrophila TaxID=225848 RepID=A0A1S6HSY5_9GAMM|nr:S24 family peptidase [Shewanella psychrophila]AQS38611.1 putative transcriptional regulator [Shewanella psychrophila]